MSNVSYRGLLPLWLCSVAVLSACQVTDEVERDAERDAAVPSFSSVTQSLSLGSALGIPISTAPAPSSTCGLNNGVSPGCGTSSASDISFEWIAPASGTYTFTTSGSNFDTALVIAPYENPAQRLACRNAVSGTGGESATLTLVGGRRLLITVDGYASLCGNYVLNISRACSGGCGSTDCVTGTCLPTGTCSYTPKAVGTICNDGNDCTYGDSCNSGGSCIGAPAQNGTACNDGEHCTGGDYCDGGWCQPGPVNTCQGNECPGYPGYEDCGNSICCPIGNACNGPCIITMASEL